MSILAKCIDCAEDATRFVKTIIAFLIANVAVGLAFQAKKDFNVMMRAVTKHTGIVQLSSNGFTMGFSFMYLVNIGCVLYSLIGLACIRNLIFRERQVETAWCRGIQCVAGPFCATYQQIVVFITLANQIMLSYIFIVMSISLGGLNLVCQGGNSMISSLQGMIDKMHGGASSSYQAGSMSPSGWFMNLDVEKYCDATKGINAATMQCFTGCLLSVLSQALMIMVISEEKGRIEGTMAEGQLVKAQQQKQKKRNGSDSDSDSSSSSSSGSDTPRAGQTKPLQQYRGGSVAGRNYKLPGGR